MKKTVIILLTLVLTLGAAAQQAQQPAKTQQTLWVKNGERQIYGVLNRPQQGAARMPLVIVSHGFNGSHHFAQDYFEPLAEMGYMTYAFDFPCGSLKSRSDANTMNMSVLDEQSDLCAIVQYFRSQPYVDKDRIILIGESQGGLVSALAAAQLSRQVSRLVLIYPALCIPDNWNARYPKLEDIPDTTRLWNVPMGRRFFEEVRDLKVFDSISAFRGPVLIIQGDADRIVSMDDSRRAVQIYKDARLHIIPGAGHGFKPQERAEAFGQIRDFLASGK